MVTDSKEATSDLFQCRREGEEGRARVGGAGTHLTTSSPARLLSLAPLLVTRKPFTQGGNGGGEVSCVSRSPPGYGTAFAA